MTADNHPAIGAIYGLERASTGGQRPAMPALVLELVEGDTLADRIRRGPVPAAAALGPYPVTLWLMCRNIETLANFQPPATEEEIKASALQFVRKLSGTTRPSRANQAVFDQAVEDVTAAAEALIRSLTTTAAPRNREEEAQRAKERSAKRFPEAARRERQAG
jgi:hypothetical protein